MEVIQNIDIEASTDHVWGILDENFGTISEWAARMLASESDPSLGTLGGRQVTTVEYGPATETLYRRDPDRRTIGYWVTGDSLPPPITDVQTEWRVTEAETGQASVEIRFLAYLLQPEAQSMLEDILHQGIAGLLDELKHFAETGEPHQNKLDARA